MSSIPINICLQTTEVHRNQNAPVNYTYTGNSGKQEVTRAFLDIEGAFYSTSRNINKGSQMAWARDTLYGWTGSMLDGSKITATLTGETLERSMSKGSLLRVILLSHSCEDWM